MLQETRLRARVANPFKIPVTSEETPTRRYLLIVRRDRPELFADLSQDFLAVQDLVEIITDRRVDERRREFRRPSLERRRTQRRYRPPRTWEEHGFLLTGRLSP